MLEELENLKAEALQLEAQKDSIPKEEFESKMETITNKLLDLMGNVVSELEKRTK